MAVCKQCGEETRRYRVVPGVGDFCLKNCAPSDEKRMKLTTFPFTTTNLGGHPGESVTVNSLAHLRRLEAKNGVSSVAYNQNERNWDPPQYDDSRRQEKLINDLREARRG